MVVIEASVGAAPVQQVLGQPSQETEPSGLLLESSNQAPRLSVSLFFLIADLN